ncbi:MAG: 16S rRNA (guanine(966)-N(2))-methyltransferase RsmD [Alphaproteobacteria bacterium]
MLTIVGGRFRRALLAQPTTAVTRPTAQRTRAAIFNILSHNSDLSLVGANAIDVFAGSGALGLEALSRGATHVTFVEQHPEAMQALKQNVHKLGAESLCTLLTLSVQRLPQATQPVDLVFIDPPYHENLETPTLEILHTRGWLHSKTTIVMETSATSQWTPPPAFHILDERRYGAARIAFYSLLRDKS